MDSGNRPALRRATISRRVLLAAGGVTLLAECIAGQASDAPPGTLRRPNVPPAPDPAARSGARAMRSSSIAVQDQMSRASDAIHHVTGMWPGMFRAPYGAWSPTVLKLCEQMQLAPLDWSVDPRDWANPGVNAIVANIMRNTRSGSIILEHDGGRHRSETVAALNVVLPMLLAAGFRFRTA